MPRPPSSHLVNIERQLRLRLMHQPHTPGARFYSNRALAHAFNISQQSAHNILDRLCSEGLLVRRPSSGTYLPGKPNTQAKFVLLVFNARAQRPGSFGHHLLQQLTAALNLQNLPYRIHLYHPTSVGHPFSAETECFPVFWEIGDHLTHFWKPGSYGLILHREPPLGLASAWLDSIQVDDRSGGVMAGELLRDTFRIKPPLAMVGGPAHDSRSERRLSGAMSVFPNAIRFHSGGWFSRHGQSIAPEVFASRPGGIFCCNDRIAEGIFRAALQNRVQLPPLIGFDNAPIAEELRLNSIAIPWREMVETALQIIQRRHRGDRSTATQRILTPLPFLRNLL